MDFIEDHLYFLIFSRINPLVLRKSESSTKSSFKAVNISYVELRIKGFEWKSKVNTVSKKKLFFTLPLAFG